MPKTEVTFETVNALTASGFDPEQAVQGKPGRLAEYMAFQLAQRRGKEELQAGGLLKNLFFRKVMRANADAVLDAVKESGGGEFLPQMNDPIYSNVRYAAVRNNMGKE